MPIIAIWTAMCYFGLDGKMFHLYQWEDVVPCEVNHSPFLDLGPNINSYGLLHVSVKWEILH